MNYRKAIPNDAPALAPMNKRLIVDEGHGNPMTVPELEARMRGWLGSAEYDVHIFEQDGWPVGYCLYKFNPDHLYLRHFYIEEAHRRHGLGRETFKWMRENVWKGRPIRLDVLVWNKSGISFWKSVGFKDYSLRMEMEA